MAIGISVVVDQFGAYGRRVLRGTAIYANTHTHWGVRVETINQLRVAVERGLVSGVIIQLARRTTNIGTGDPSGMLTERGIPTVNVSGRLQESPFPRVANDDAAIGRMAAEYFLARGFTHFAFAGLHPTYLSWVRGEAFAAALRKAGFETQFANHTLHGTPTRPVADLFRNLPVPCALLGGDDNLAKQAVTLALERGLRVPEDVAVLGVENDPLLCELASVPISSIQTGAEKVGFEAARLLHRLLEGRPAPSSDILIPPQAVITRRSTDVMATADAHVATTLSHIRKHAFGPLSPADVLEQVPLSRRMMELRFKRAVGRTIGEEIVRVRLERAKRLLAESDLQIGEVAAASGFAEARYMNVAFRRHLAMTPKSYRRSLQLV